MNICIITDCGGKILARGWCRLHYSRWYRTGSTDITRAENRNGVCSIDGCSLELRAREMCPKHYERDRKYGDPHHIDFKRGKDSPAWKGGRMVNKQGYVRVNVGKTGYMFPAMVDRHGYVLEHRKVIAENLGRELSRHETVHHINGNKQDNRLENLQLRSGQHGQGVSRKCGDCGSINIISEEL